MTRWRPGCVALVAVFVVVFVAWIAIAAFSMYPVWPWEWAYRTGRYVIRAVWAALTGQSSNLDLFP